MRIIFLLSKLFGQSKLRFAKRILGLPEYDTVVAFRSGICTQLAAYAIDAKKKLTWWHHGEIIVDKTEYIEAANELDQIIVVSNACMDMVAAAFPSLKHKMTVIPNIIDLDLIEMLAEKHDIPSELKAENGALQIATICRIAPEKHVENIIASALQLKQLGIPFHWVVIGDGDERRKLEEEAREHSLGKELAFVGTLDNPYPLLKSADIYVHPSYVESQGISILEALSLHIPCVVTRSLGPQEYLVDHENALVVEHGSIALSDAIVLLYQDKELYTRIKFNSVCPQRYLPINVMKLVEQVL